MFTYHLLSVIKECECMREAVRFCGDNCNTNFDGIKKEGKNSAFLSTGNRSKYNWNWMCSTHSAQKPSNCSQVFYHLILKHLL
jgi:hypothetical protein